MALKDEDIEKYLGEVENTYKLMVDKKPEIVKKVGEEFSLLYLYSRELVKYSDRLGRWTKVIAGLTLLLFFLTCVHIFLILNYSTIKWF